MALSMTLSTGGSLGCSSSETLSGWCATSAWALTNSQSFLRRSQPATLDAALKDWLKTHSAVSLKGSVPFSDTSPFEAAGLNVINPWNVPH
jgi:hypothetical protein